MQSNSSGSALSRRQVAKGLAWATPVVAVGAAAPAFAASPTGCFRLQSSNYSDGTSASGSFSLSPLSGATGSMTLTMSTTQGAGTALGNNFKFDNEVRDSNGGLVQGLSNKGIILYQEG